MYIAMFFDNINKSLSNNKLSQLCPK